MSDEVYLLTYLFWAGLAAMSYISLNLWFSLCGIWNDGLRLRHGVGPGCWLLAGNPARNTKLLDANSSINGDKIYVFIFSLNVFSDTSIKARIW